MKKTVLVLFLCFFAVSWASAQEVLTPAQQRQKEKIAEEIQRQQKIKAEMAQKQRDYEAKQAEKERQRQAKRAAKEGNQPQPAPTPVADTPPVSQPDPVVNTPTEPVKKEKKPKRVKEKTPEPTPVATPAEPTPTPTPVDTPAVMTEKPAEPEEVRRVKREKKAVRKSVDPRSMKPGTAITVEPTTVRANGEFLPKGHLFEPIILDPLEAQTYGSFLPGYWTEGQKYKGSFVPFAFGFAKPFYRRTTQPGHSEEWVLDLASFTQFEAYHDDVSNKAARRIVNTDYKVSIIYNIRRNENNYRIRVYHLSSHLGDDYIFRNKITAPSPNSVNYELLDFTYSRTVNDWRLYGGAGIVLRKSEERKPLSAQIGAFYKKPSAKAARLVGGVDVKFWQQTDFRPGIHGGIGFELGRTQNNLTFMLEGYSGFRPYSQFEQQQTSWMGIGLYLNPF